MVKARHIVMLGGVALIAVGLFVIKYSREAVRRREFRFQTEGGQVLNGISFSPGTATPECPLVIYLHGSGWRTAQNEPEMRTLAKSGLVVVDFDYDQMDQTVFTDQMLSLLKSLKKQDWSANRHIAWMGFSLGAQRLLTLALLHPEAEPELMIRLGGGWVETLDIVDELPAWSGNIAAHSDPGHKMTNNPIIRCPLLLIQGGDDQTYPVEECKRIEALMQARGTVIELRILPGRSHNFNGQRIRLMEEIGKYCRSKLDAQKSDHSLRVQ